MPSSPTTGAARRPARPSMLDGPIAPILLRMTGPVVLGILLILLFNVVDTWFVGLLGTQELAAISFTFPVCFILINIAMAIGTATTSLTAMRLGQGDVVRARRLNLHALGLSVAVIVPLSTLGILTIGPLFSLLGAGPELLPMIRDYMVTWYAGVVFLAIPMTAHAAIRATGDTRTPSIVMGIAGLLNGVLDPIFMFHFEMGIRGAALATLVSWLFASCGALRALLHIDFVSFRRCKEQPWAQSRRDLLKIAAPAALTNLAGPLSSAILTAIVATHGAHAVAAYGVGTRVEALALVVIIALTSAASPFIGQNYGAGNHQRIAQGLRVVFQLCLAWSALAITILAFTGDSIALLFSNDSEIQKGIVLYLQIVPAGYFGLGFVMIICASLNVLRRALLGTIISVGRLFFLAIPVAWLGDQLYGLTGLFVGIVLANLVSGVVAFLWFRAKIHSRTLTTLHQDA
ncbi:MatE efflux family protein [gamma proteobacterium HdN1]|nr:MatE efflux family protein [gamma proteobacterium HdN1]